MKPIVAVVGRPNVGKSTLFNRLIGKRQAIVEDDPGVTRDRLYRDCNWLDYDFLLIDTGGIEFKNKDSFFAGKIKEQAKIAIEEANVIILVLDGRDGLTQEDEEVAQLLRKSGKPVVLAVNKLESEKERDNVYEFYNLGLGDPIAISANHGTNVGDLLDEVVKHLPNYNMEKNNEESVNIAVVGRPNVGKSSLVNRLIGKERSIVSDIPGTTRDAIDTAFIYRGKPYVLIDTAGMRKKKRVVEPTERYSVARTLRAVDESDVVIIVLDAQDGVTEQDQKIAGYAHEAGKAIVVAVNKWDLIDKDNYTMPHMEAKIKDNLKFMNYAYIIFISALTGQRVDRVMTLVGLAYEQSCRRQTMPRINEVLQNAILLNPPPSEKGKKLRIYYGEQVGIKPPKFVIFVNDPKLVHFSYERYLENQMRENFNLKGTTVWFKFKTKDKEISR